MDKFIKVSINDVEYKIHKMPLKKIALVLDAVEELPSHFASLDGLSGGDVLNKLPHLVSEGLPELARVLSIASDIEEEIILNDFGLDDLSEVIVAIRDVNKLDKFADNVKKLMARQDKKSKKTGSGEQLTP